MVVFFVLIRYIIFYFLAFRMPKDEIIEFITSCQDSESGGISSSIGHDPHMLYTLSAVQVS